MQGPPPDRDTGPLIFGLQPGAAIRESGEPGIVAELLLTSFDADGTLDLVKVELPREQASRLRGALDILLGDVEE